MLVGCAVYKASTSLKLCAHIHEHTY